MRKKAYNLDEDSDESVLAGAGKAPLAASALAAGLAVAAAVLCLVWFFAQG